MSPRGDVATTPPTRIETKSMYEGNVGPTRRLKNGAVTFPATYGSSYQLKASSPSYLFRNEELSGTVHGDTTRVFVGVAD